MSVNGNYSLISMYNSAQFLHAGNALKNGSAARLLSDLKTPALNSGVSSYLVQNRYSDPQTTRSSLNNLIDLKNGSAKLRAAAGDLSKARSARTAVSSNPQAVSVSARSGGAAALMKPTAIQASRLASGQVNRGAEFSGAEKSFTPGTYRFEVEQNGETTGMSVEVAAGDTNRDVLEKMAAAVNSQNSGISAVARSDAASGAVTLELSARSEGANEQSRFAIRDTEGGLAAAAGVTAASQEAQDAVYSLNGGPDRVSASNDIDLGFGVTARLRQTTSEPVRIAGGPDGETAKQALKDLAEGFNTLSATANENNGSIAATQLAMRLNTVFAVSSSALASVGITADENGQMKIDSAALDRAAANGKLSDFLAGGGKNLASRLSNTAASVNRNPAAFAGFNRVADSLYDYLGGNADNAFTFASQDFGYTGGGFNKGYFLNMLV
ncbi:MAG: hypothetical protein LBH21_05875 [Gracilibacteraceae bacterium]|jgi:flagellar capping protein FliD|nr:hypothetical protein [Gracilibacteraceae bacterium]